MTLLSLPTRIVYLRPRGRRATSLLAISLLLALTLACALSGASVKSGVLSAHLSKKSFAAAQAKSVTLVYKLSEKSTYFSYKLSFKQGSKWQLVKAVKKDGSFKGTHRMRVRKLFAGKRVRVGFYRLKLRADAGHANLLFQVAKAGGAVAISAGWGHTCALLSGGRVKCWGEGEYGQLGNGSTLDSSTPVEMSGIPNASQISAGGEHTCVLIYSVVSGTVKCWGDGEYGQLGKGDTSDSFIPAEVIGITDAVQISAGGGHTCALFSGGRAECWGYNGYGQLGNGSTLDSPTPVGVSSITDATQISAGGWHTCALTHSNGAVKCWGYNGYGQLGNGSTLDSSTPVEVSSITDAAPVQVSAGGRHTCALLSDGTVECWGNGEYGQLGNGSTLDSSTPVEVSGITNATQISAGEAHTCALLSVGTVKCWGDNGDGELGNGATDDSSFPVEVSGITNAVQISAGGLHTCALLSGGTVKCWGGNGDGELGNGSTLDSSIPVNVVGFS